MKRFSKKENLGITLVALVVTIIILLILAGVAIATLTGENGLLKKAQQAKTETDESTLKEAISLAVMNARLNEDTMGEIDLGLLEKELNNQGIKKEEITKGEGEKLPWKIAHGGFIFNIQKSGEVEKVEGLAFKVKTVKLRAGKTKNLASELEKTPDVKGTIKYESSDPSKIEVDSNGNITVKGTEGSATITVTAEGTTYSAQCKVIIAKEVEGVKIVAPTSGKLEIEKGETDIIKLAPTNDDAEDVEYIVESSDASKTYVDYVVDEDTIKVTAKAVTTADIQLKIKAKGKDTQTQTAQITCRVEVFNRTITTKEQFKTIKDNLSGNYKLGEDLDFSNDGTLSQAVVKGCFSRNFRRCWT